MRVNQIVNTPEPVPSRRSQVNEQIDSLRAMTSSLHEQVNYLNDRVKPISMDQPQPAPDNKEPKQQALCPVAESLRDIANSIHAANQALDYITRCIEV